MACSAMRYNDDTPDTLVEITVDKSTLINLIAEKHYAVRPMMKSALERQILTEAGKSQHPGASTYWDVFTSRFGHQFFDMSTMVQLGTAIEVFLRDKYMEAAGHRNLAELRKDANYKKGAFQRIGIQANGRNDAAALLHSVNIDLSSKAELQAAREIMIHRHLYAHSSGLIDEDYITNWQALTGEDLLQRPGIANALVVDTYWFHPLTQITEYIEKMRRFTRYF